MGKESETVGNSLNDAQTEDQSIVTGNVDSGPESEESIGIEETNVSVLETGKTEAIETEGSNTVDQDIAKLATHEDELHGEIIEVPEAVESLEEQELAIDGEDGTDSVLSSEGNTVSIVTDVPGQNDTDDNDVVTYRSRKRILTGTVVSDKGNQTVVVSIARRKKHRLYKKYITVTKKIKAHDPHNECRTGDLVTVIESRPLSKEKRWRLIKILKRSD